MQVVAKVGEDCGSTQRLSCYLMSSTVPLFALHEGKRLLWTMVPVEEEYHYDEYVNSLYAQGVLTPNE